MSEASVLDLLADDDIEDDIPLEKEALLLRGDDENDSYEELDYEADESFNEKEEETTHREKFSNERLQKDETSKANMTITPTLVAENKPPKFTSSRGGWGRGRGYMNGPGRRGVSRCFPSSILKQVPKKLVQSVQPWLNPPRDYVVNGNASGNVSFNGRYEQEIYQNPAPIHTLMQRPFLIHPSKYNDQYLVQLELPKTTPFNPASQIMRRTHVNDGYPQNSNYPFLNQPSTIVNRNLSTGFNQNHSNELHFNQIQFGFNANQQFRSNVGVGNFDKPAFGHTYGHNPPNYSSHTRPLLYAPTKRPQPWQQQPPVQLNHLTREGASFHSVPRFEPPPPIPNENIQIRNTRSRPANGHRFEHSQTGSWAGRHRPNQQWHNRQDVEQNVKRKSCDSENKKGLNDDVEKEKHVALNTKEKLPTMEAQKMKPEFPNVSNFPQAQTPKEVEDNEMKAYRRKIEVQKRKREEFLASKERKRKLIASMKTDNAQTQERDSRDPQPSLQPSHCTNMTLNASNVNGRSSVKTVVRTDGEKIELITGSVTKVNVKPGMARKTAPGGSGFLSSRRVFTRNGQRNAVVVVSNLNGKSWNKPQLRKMY